MDTFRKIKVTRDGVQEETEFQFDLKTDHKIYVSKLNNILLDFSGSGVEINRMSIDRNSAPSFVTEIEYPADFTVDCPKYFSDDFTMYLKFEQVQEKNMTTYKLKLYQIVQQGGFGGVMRVDD